MRRWLDTGDLAAARRRPDRRAARRRAHAVVETEQGRGARPVLRRRPGGVPRIAARHVHRWARRGRPPTGADPRRRRRPGARCATARSPHPGRDRPLRHLLRDGGPRVASTVRSPNGPTGSTCAIPTSTGATRRTCGSGCARPTASYATATASSPWPASPTCSRPSTTPPTSRRRPRLPGALGARRAHDDQPGRPRPPGSAPAAVTDAHAAGGRGPRRRLPRRWCVELVDAALAEHAATGAGRGRRRARRAAPVPHHRHDDRVRRGATGRRSRLVRAPDAARHARRRPATICDEFMAQRRRVDGRYAADHPAAHRRTRPTTSSAGGCSRRTARSRCDERHGDGGRAPRRGWRRDDPDAHQPRPADLLRSPRPVGAAARRARAHPRGGRGAAAVGQPAQQHVPHRRARHRGQRPADRRGRAGGAAVPGGQPRSGGVRATRTASTSPARRRCTWRSGTARTSASAPTWPASRCACCSRSSPRGSPTCAR